MINITVVGNNERIVGSFFGKDFSIPYDKAIFDSMSDIESRSASIQTGAEIEALRDEFNALLNDEVTKRQSDEAPELFVDETGTYFLQHNNVISSIPMPQSIVDRILLAVDKGISYQPIIKFWVRLLRNPQVVNAKSFDDAVAFTRLVCNYVTRTFVSPVLYKQMIDSGYSEEKAKEYATVQQTPLTMEGLISTKKVVTPLWDRMRYAYKMDEEGNVTRILRQGVADFNSDTGEINFADTNDIVPEDFFFQPYVMGSGGDAFHCGDEGLGHVIKIGQEQRLDSWDQVNCNSNSSCCKGLHTGNQDYINSFETSGNMTLNCFVDPMNVGAVPNGENVFRVLALFPHSIKDRETDNRNIYHSSTYAAENDARWNVMKQEAVERFTQERDDIVADYNKSIDETNAL